MTTEQQQPVDEQPEPLTDAEREAAATAGWSEDYYRDLKQVKTSDEWWEARRREGERTKHGK